MNPTDTPPADAEIFVPHVGWLAHEPEDEVAYFLRQGHYEFAEQAFLWLFLRPDDTVIDAGAHFGLYSVLAAKAMQGCGRILSIEPNPRSAVSLRRNLEAHAPGCAEISNVALWSAEGPLQWQAANSPGRAAYNHVQPATTPRPGQTDPAGAAEVAGTTLRTLVEGLCLGPVAFLKLDLEGAEIACIDGAADLLKAGKFPLLMVEFTELNLRQYGRCTRDLFSCLETAGLTLCRFDPLTVQLQPASYTGEIWYENLFAARDLDSVNRRLREAAPPAQRIAQDIIERGRACQKIRELQELDYYKAKAEEADALQRWAERSDLLLSQACGEAQANRQWAEQVEGRVAQERQWREELRLALEKTSQALAEEHRRCAELALALKQANGQLL